MRSAMVGVDAETNPARIDVVLLSHPQRGAATAAPARAPCPQRCGAKRGKGAAEAAARFCHEA